MYNIKRIDYFECLVENYFPNIHIYINKILIKLNAQKYLIYTKQII